MKLSSLAILIFVFSPLHAKSVDSKKEIKTLQKEKPSVSRGYEVVGALVRRDMRDRIGNQLMGTGITGSFGKIFHLGANVSTTTALKGEYISLGQDDIARNSDNVGMIDVGLTQKLSYNISSNGAVVSPFIEGDVAVGTLFATFSSGSNDARSTVNYLKYGGSAGLQVAFSNNLAPFIKYNFSQLEFSEAGRVSGTVDGRDFSQSYNLSSSADDRTVDVHSITLGFGYLF